MRRKTLYAASAVDVKTTLGTTPTFDVSESKGLLFLFELTALSGGTTPSVAVKYQEQDVAGNWFDITSIIFTPITAPGKAVQFNSYAGLKGRIQWIIVGAPTTATANISIYAEPIT